MLLTLGCPFSFVVARRLADEAISTSERVCFVVARRNDTDKISYLYEKISIFANVLNLIRSYQ